MKKLFSTIAATLALPFTAVGQTAAQEILKTTTDGGYFTIRVKDPDGVLKGYEALLKRIDAALTDMNKDGAMEQCSKKYFSWNGIKHVLGIYPVRRNATTVGHILDAQYGHRWFSNGRRVVLERSFRLIEVWQNAIFGCWPL